MKFNKQKAGLFLTGLLAGITLSGMFFIFKLDGYFKDLNVYKRYVKSIENQAENKTIIAEDKSEDVYKPTSKDDPTTSPVTKPNENLSVSQPILTDGIVKTDSITNPSEIIYFKNDELMLSKTIKLINTNVQTNVYKDTLTAMLAGVKEIKPIESLKVEYWLSPLNYKGYRMSRSKLLLYGLSADENVKLYEVEGAYYLQSGGEFYYLDMANEFKTFDRLVDAELITKLKMGETSAKISLQR